MQWIVKETLLAAKKNIKCNACLYSTRRAI